MIKVGLGLESVVLLGLVFGLVLQSGLASGLYEWLFYRATVRPHTHFDIKTYPVATYFKPDTVAAFKPVFASNKVSRPVPDLYSDRYTDYEYKPRASASNYSNTSSTDNYEISGSGRASHGERSLPLCVNFPCTVLSVVCISVPSSHTACLKFLTLKLRQYRAMHTDTTPLHPNIVIIFDTVVREKQNLKREK